MCTTTIDVNPHGTFVILVGPLFSTVELVSNGLHGDKYALGLVTILVTMFVPLCLLGDALKEARLCVGDRAYQGPWLEESRRERAVRLGMMHSAGVGRDTLLRARGVGPIDRVFCSNALKNWFTFLQYLLNLGEPNTK
ncbi:hypothetical protein ONE63_011016 [Megalurothrips usitatus]|uniref:Uncharacterized protein n=1 Tax=Megalurothrips usitatus TaxID=439358 RepID=A0AAV7XIK1_9NEOP|nr:hypothetical protein ONE63_011016 [Megalurothrips usitatus]